MPAVKIVHELPGVYMIPSLQDGIARGSLTKRHIPKASKNLRVLVYFPKKAAVGVYFSLDRLDS